MRLAPVLTAIVLGACGSSPAPAVQPSIPVDSEARDQPVTDTDLHILHRADEILASAAVWNRHDTRDCHDTDTTWSLFCALQKASFDVAGAYHHRAVALQEVRFAVEEATAGLALEHRLMDFNNLETTTFDDVKHVLAVAIERVTARLAAQPRD